MQYACYSFLLCLWIRAKLTSGSNGSIDYHEPSEHGGVSFKIPEDGPLSLERVQDLVSTGWLFFKNTLELILKSDA